jgi:hypothetical protein
MLDFVAITREDGISSQGYELGIQHYLASWIRGKDVYGHSGGNIGTVAYMLYLPEYGVSIAAMMNSFSGRSNSVKGLARAAVIFLRDR